MIAAANLGELLDTAALLASQPVPAGGRVGVVPTPRRRGARRRRVRRRRPAGRLPGRGHPAGAAGHARPRGPGGRAGRYHRAGRARQLPPVPGACRRRPGRRRGAGADHHDRRRRPGSRGGRRAAAGADRRGRVDQVELVRRLPRPGHDSPASRPTPTRSPPSAPWATPRATAPGGRPRRDGC